MIPSLVDDDLTPTAEPDICLAYGTFVSSSLHFKDQILFKDWD